jgi:hypothetical protein
MPHTDDDALACSRIFDDGGRLVLRDESPDRGMAEFLALDTVSCTGTGCMCHEMELLAQPLALVAGQLVEGGAAPLQALLDVESGEVSVGDAPEPGSEKAALLLRLRRLLQGDQLDALRERWGGAPPPPAPPHG